MSPKPKREPPEPPSLLVVAPTRRELGGLRSLIAAPMAPETLPRNQRGGVSVAVVGLGPAAGLALATSLAAERPAAVLSLGFAGALTSGLRTGDLVLCHRAVTPAGGPAVDADAALAAMAQGALASAGVSADAGPLLSVPEPLLTPESKRRYGESSGAAVVDMEGRALLEAAAEAGVPMVMVRAVLDELDHRLPHLAASIITGAAHGAVNRNSNEWLLAARAVLARPWEAPSLPALALRSRKAANALASAARVLVPALTASARSVAP